MSSLTITEALRRAGASPVSESYPHQISCPFHGMDSKPSMRVYPEQNSAYCWVCSRSFNPIAVIAHAEEIPYGKARAQVLAEFGIVPERTKSEEPPDDLLIAALSNQASRLQALQVLTLLCKGEDATEEIESLYRFVYSRTFYEVDSL